MLPTAAGASRGQGSVTTAAQTTQIATTIARTTTREEHKQPQVQPLWRRHNCQQGGQVEWRGEERVCSDGPQRVPFCSVHKFFTTFEKSATMAIKLILPATNYATPPCRTVPLTRLTCSSEKEKKGARRQIKLRMQWQNKICIKNKLQQKSGRKENKKEESQKM